MLSFLWYYKKHSLNPTSLAIFHLISLLLFAAKQLKKLSVFIVSSSSPICTETHTSRSPWPFHRNYTCQSQKLPPRFKSWAALYPLISSIWHDLSLFCPSLGIQDAKLSWFSSHLAGCCSFVFLILFLLPTFWMSECPPRVSSLSSSLLTYTHSLRAHPISGL